MIRTKLLFHTTKKDSTYFDRRTCAFIAHQGRSPEKTCREEVMRH